MTKKISFFLFVLFILSFSSTLAATKQDVIGAINKTYTVGNETYRLPQSIIDRGTAYLNQKNLSSEQYDRILGCINGALNVARNAGTTDISKVSKEDRIKGLNYVYAAAETAEVDLSKPPTTNTISNNNSSSSEDFTNDSWISGEISGEIINMNDVISGETSGEIDLDKLTAMVDLSMNSNPEADHRFDQIVIYIVIGIIVIIILNIFIIYLIFKSKWNKILKYIVIILFVLTILVALIALGVLVLELDEIRILYKFYYIMK